MYLGLLSSDINQEHERTHFEGITRRYVLGLTLMSVAILLLALPVLQFAIAVFAPVPFEYRNLPFRVCSPTSTITSCDDLKPNEVFHPADVIPFVVDRCATDPFARSTVLPYVVSRNVVNDLNGTRLILPSLSTEVPAGGCDQSVTFAHQLPETLAPGRYYIEGVATVYGRFRIVNAYFRTDAFTVAKKDE